MKPGADETDAGDTQPAPVVLEEHGGVAVIRINRPAQRNSISVATLSALE